MNLKSINEKLLEYFPTEQQIVRFVFWGSAVMFVISSGIMMVGFAMAVMK